MVKYSVKQLSKLAGVTPKTLRYYDAIDLLIPTGRAESGYRYYSKEELYRLQQILFYKELDFSLEGIKQILDQPDFDLVQSLEGQRMAILEKIDRFSELIKTIDKTILTIKDKENMISDEEMYAGFPKESVQSMKEEVKQRWGADKLEQTESNIQKMDKNGWEEIQNEAKSINERLASKMHLKPKAIEVQELISEHFTHMNRFNEFNIIGYKGLGEMYATDERFKAHYEVYATGLSEFIKDAISVFCENGLKVLR